LGTIDFFGIDMIGVSEFCQQALQQAM